MTPKGQSLVRGDESAMARDPEALLTLGELEMRAVELLSPHVHKFIAGGAGTGASVAANISAWSRWAVVPRVLADVASRTTATTVLGCPIDLPAIIAPAGLQTLVTAEGEVATALGARDAGTVMVLSAGTGRSIEDVAKSGADLWMQVYWGRDRGLLRSIIETAIDSGVQAICLTVDLVAPPLIDRAMEEALKAIGSVQPRYMQPRSVHLNRTEQWDHDPTLTWRDLEWLRSVSRIPVVLKGIMSAADASNAVESGVDAIVVSNHGGRALDNRLATADVLPEVVEVVGARAEVLVDGGIRHGGDIFVARALGARAVLIGRPALWGLAVAGSRGVTGVLAGLRHQFDSSLASAGLRSPDEIGNESIRRLAAPWE
jgi:4-hydroxymandelate oxidase